MSAPYRWAVRAYPDDFRAAHGEELIATAVELHPSGWSLRQAWSLFVGGLRMRSHRDSSHSPAGAVASGIRVALFVYSILLVAGPITSLVGLTNDTTYDSSGPVLVAPLIVAVLLTMTSRWPVAVAVTVLAAASAVRTSTSPSEIVRTSHVVAGVVFAVLVAGSAWWLAVRGDGKRAVRPTTAAAALAAGVLLAWLFGGSDGNVLLTVTALLIVGGVILAAVDPRVLVAGTACWVMTMTIAVPAWGVVGPRSVVTWISVAIACALAVACRRSVNRLRLASI